jgi:hypothetical protein
MRPANTRNDTDSVSYAPRLRIPRSTLSARQRREQPPRRADATPSHHAKSLIDDCTALLRLMDGLSGPPAALALADRLARGIRGRAAAFLKAQREWRAKQLALRVARQAALRDENRQLRRLLTVRTLGTLKRRFAALDKA